MNNYHNPYRNPYPGQGTNRFANAYGTPSADPNGQTDENRQKESGQTKESHSSAQNQGQNVPPTGSSENTGWQNDPSLKNMDLKKLAFLSELVAESGNKSLDTLLPFLISANKNANAMGLQFNDAETGLLLEVLKKHMSPEEQSRIDMLRKMADVLGKKQ
ncbi:MAG: hypothetical protein HFI67_08215 [Lachnospiraceae bacterium]|nr:hypothetical protein [Lachnospiraceae bacterium]